MLKKALAFKSYSLSGGEFREELSGAYPLFLFSQGKEVYEAAQCG